MKVVAIALTALVLGIAVGLTTTWAEVSRTGNYFRHENLAVPPVGVAAEETKVAGDKIPRAVVVGGPEHHFGTMEQHSIGKHDFVIRNVGTAPLRLRVASTTCKCTMGKVGNDDLQPGESTKVHLEWEAKEFSLQYSQAAEIQTNDPDYPVIRLIIEGIVDQRVTVAPEMIALPRLSSSDTTSTTIHVFTVKKPDFKVTGFEMLDKKTREFFDVKTRSVTPQELRSHPRSNGGIAVVVSVKPGMPNGRFRQTLRLTTNDLPKQIEVPIEGNVISDVSVVGGAKYDSKSNVYRFGILKSEEKAEAELLVLIKGKDRDKVKLSIGSVDPEDVVKVALGKPKTRGRVVAVPLKVSIPPGSPSTNRYGSRQGKYGQIVIETTHPNVKRVVVYLKFAIEG